MRLTNFGAATFCILVLASGLQADATNLRPERESAGQHTYLVKSRKDFVVDCYTEATSLRSEGRKVRVPGYIYELEDLDLHKKVEAYGDEGFKEQIGAKIRYPLLMYPRLPLQTYKVLCTPDDPPKIVPQRNFEITRVMPNLYRIGVANP